MKTKIGIFFLGQKFEMYSCDIDLNNIELIDTQERTSKYLNLGEHLEDKWEQNWEQLSELNSIYFIFNQTSGFNDTRMVFLWLKSYRLIDHDFDFYTTTSTYADFESWFISIDKSNLKLKVLLNQSFKNPLNIKYNSEPRIHKK
jgi:hypothetical protein